MNYYFDYLKSVVKFVVDLASKSSLTSCCIATIKSLSLIILTLAVITIIAMMVIAPFLGLYRILCKPSAFIRYCEKYLEFRDNASKYSSYRGSILVGDFSHLYDSFSFLFDYGFIQNQPSADDLREMQAMSADELAQHLPKVSYLGFSLSLLSNLKEYAKDHKYATWSGVFDLGGCSSIRQLRFKSICTKICIIILYVAFVLSLLIPISFALRVQFIPVIFIIVSIIGIYRHLRQYVYGGVTRWDLYTGKRWTIYSYDVKD